MTYIFIRMVCSFLVGVLLSQSGSLIQLGTRNILSSPSTLGFDGLAVLWLLIFHSVSLALGWDLPIEWTLILGVPLFIFIGTVFPKFLKGQSKFEKIILIGITFNLFVGAIFSLWQFLFMAFNLPFPVELWFGHFRYAQPIYLVILLALEVLLLLGLAGKKRDIQLFSIGPAVSSNWNLDEKRLFRFIFVSIAIVTLVIVNLFGAFSFLALVFPIMSRKLWFSSADLKGEFIFGAVVNGLALMAVDAFCYFNPIYGAEVPVGLIATAVGAVSLIALLWSRYKAS